MSFGPPFTDVRVEVPDISIYDLRSSLPGLMAVNMHPPASGPEVEFVFGTAEGASGAASEDFIRSEVERITGRSVLACRRRFRR
jgi:hypothetical protein